jgi:hypothetical protein
MKVGRRTLARQTNTRHANLCWRETLGAEDFKGMFFAPQRTKPRFCLSCVCVSLTKLRRTGATVPRRLGSGQVPYFTHLTHELRAFT